VLLCRFWHESDSLCSIKSWFEEDQDVVSVNTFSKGHGAITVKCGDLNCKFEVKTFCHGNKRNVQENSIQSSTSTEV